MKRNHNKNANNNADLSPRKRPEQKRAEKTVDHILDTAAILIDEVGLDKFNTNLLAQRSNTKVPTVYRYFPNKLAILTALIQRWMEVLKDGLTGFAEIADRETDWHETINNLVDTYVVLAKNHTGFMAIRRAMLAAPELREIELQYHHWLSTMTTKAIEARGVDISTEKLLIFTQTYMSAAAAALDLAWVRSDGNSFSEDIVDEVKVMSISYFSYYLNK